MSDLADAMAYAFTAALARWVILRTHPPTAMHRETGELIDLPELPE